MGDERESCAVEGTGGVTWARFDDGYPDHPKIMGLSDRAFRAHVTWICWANKHLTDGLIPKKLLPPNIAKELAVAGLLDDADDSWRLHDFLDYSPSRKQVESKREARAEAGRKGGLKSRRSKPKANDKQTLKQTLKQTEQQALSKPRANDKQTLSKPRANEKQTLSKKKAKLNPGPTPLDHPQPPPKDPTGSDTPRGAGQQQQPCPVNLDLTADQRAALEVAMIPKYGVDQLLAKFVSKWAGSGSRTLEQWRRSAVSAINGDWNNPKTRPKPPDTSAPADDVPWGVS